MRKFNPQAYGPVFAPLLTIDRRRPLDAARPDAGALGALKKLTVDSAFAHVGCAVAGVSDPGHKQPIDAEMAACCVSGVWLLHDYLDESHKISQDIETTSGSFWHAIMHRREGDFGNAKYWFRRVGRHPAFEAISQRVHLVESLRDSNSRLGETRPREWDPFAFVDLCEAAVRGSSDACVLCLAIQQAEWELLFDYCYREAVGH